jgi:hypothetical protein
MHQRYTGGAGAGAGAEPPALLSILALLGAGATASLLFAVVNTLFVWRLLPRPLRCGTRALLGLLVARNALFATYALLASSPAAPLTAYAVCGLLTVNWALLALATLCVAMYTAHGRRCGALTCASSSPLPRHTLVFASDVAVLLFATTIARDEYVLGEYWEPLLLAAALLACAVAVAVRLAPTIALAALQQQPDCDYARAASADPDASDEPEPDV